MSDKLIPIPDRCYEFAKRITALCDWLFERPGTSLRMADQLFRAGTAVGALAEEAVGGESKLDFIHKYAISRKEARESRYWLRLARDTGKIPPERMKDLLDEAEQIVSILTATVKTARKNYEQENANRRRKRD